MQFDRIWLSGSHVELDYAEALNGATKDITEKGQDPTTALKAALQAFGGYVNWVISGPESWADDLHIRGVTIKRHDDEPLGIVVTALKKCARARGTTMTINTPYLTERPDGGSGDSTGFLPDTVVAFVDELEVAAEAYHNGERGEQPSLFSENADTVDRAMRAASSAATKKARSPKRKADTIEGLPVMNPGDVADVSDAELRQLLLMVERDVPVDAITRTWTGSERSAAIRWATIRQQELAGALGDLATVPAEPACILRDATPALLADPDDVNPPPRKRTPEALEKAKDDVRAAVESER